MQRGEHASETHIGMAVPLPAESPEAHPMTLSGMAKRVPCEQHERGACKHILAVRQLLQGDDTG